MLSVHSLKIYYTDQTELIRVYGGGGENRTPTKSLQSFQAPITSHPHIETHSNSFPSFALTASVLEVNVFQYGAPRGT